MIVFFYLSLFLLVYVYVLFPFSLKVLYFIKGRKEIEGNGTEFKVSIIIAAHNEEHVIEQKILNTLTLDYPESLLEILIGDDGSTDETAEIVKKYSDVADSNIFLIQNAKNEGKAAMLNKLCSAANGDILLFSDSNTMLEIDAVRNIIEYFEDDVGLVCGHLILDTESDYNLNVTESKYWNFESKLKTMEGALGAVMGSNGALYAILRELYPTLPTKKTVMDDFYITASILKSGYRCVFAETAVCTEQTSSQKYGEFWRKVRIGRANFNFLSQYLPLLNLKRPLVAYLFLSHKLLRWFSPHLLLLLLASSILLINVSVFYKACLYFETAFVMFAVGSKKIRYFLSMNFALFLGFIKSFFPEKSGAWQRIEREKRD